MAATTTDAHAAHTHPPDSHYIKIAVALAALTAAETATYFVDVFDDNTPLLLIVLMPIMLFKFGWVAYSFMHLGSDSRVFTRFFVTGIFLASLVYIIFLLTFDTFFSMPKYQLHPEVWVLLVALVALGYYAVRVVGPKAVRDGSPIVTHRQVGWWATGIAVLFVATQWPIHDIAEERLYSVHMAQHVLLSYVAPPIFLLATPMWLARLLVGEGRWPRRLCHPVVAAVLFNAVVIFTHWQTTVNTSVANGTFHYGVHVLVVFSSLLVWMPICGPVPELRLSLPAQMIYLFLMSIIPTVPAAWLVFAEGVVYSSYDTPVRLWGLSATTDQQIAGLIMKLIAGFYLWGLIFVLFLKWSKRHMEANKVGRTLSERQILTWDDVKDELTEPGVTPSGR